MTDEQKQKMEARAEEIAQCIEGINAGFRLEHLRLSAKAWFMRGCEFGLNARDEEVKVLREALIQIANDTSDNRDFFLQHTAQEALEHTSKKEGAE